ncbi:hypothetical protein K450DRAFT_196217 [Umbelopsis ramanniana AG]|uniref:Rho-GAP domain-containing protein n=1 Tax=Umbelopsis ramanniana AG TaxID=1314678 RepID=A0AAD5EGJ5_UMBRA|nr:uncharacterized protein K450DRAFT_196217 [Umbelopsis ramanniana AG]KAI8583453.1 hypothetical protein K450DRAFT_196217 [Umbelopsis ramanniana AG]
MTKNPSKKSTLQQFGKRSRSLRFGEFFARFPNLRKSQPHFEVVVSPDQFGSVADPENALIFGASLHDILERAPFTTKGRLCIPYVLHRCFSEISKKALADITISALGIRSEGLFRLSGSAPKILQLESIFSQEPHFGKDIDLSAYDVHTLAGTFKKLLRSLPEPVIPHHLHVYYLNGYRKSASDEQNLSILSSLGHRMDAEHFDLLKYIIAVAAYVESEKESNKMTSEALAIVLAPTCTGLDGIINKLPATANRMSASMGRTSNGRTSTTSNNVLQLSVVKDLEQWTSLFQFMINYHEELLQNWTGENQSEDQVQESAESIQESASESEIDAESEVLPSPVSLEAKEEIPAPVSPLRTDFRLSFEDFVLPELSLESLTSRETRSEGYENIDIGSSTLNVSQGDNSSTEYFTPISERPDEETQDDNNSENSEEELQDSEEKQAQEHGHQGESHFQGQTSSTFPSAPTPRTPKTPREELMALKSGRENMYNQLLRQWKSREESRSPRATRSRSQTGSGAFSRSVLCTSTQVAPAAVPAPQLVILCEGDIKERAIEEDVVPLTPKTEQQGMKTILTRHSIDSGVYSADGLSLSDLE